MHAQGPAIAHPHTHRIPPRLPRADGDAARRLSTLFDARQPVRHVQPGESILCQGAQARTLYRIVSGTVRCCTFSEDGFRQIFRFAIAGDCIGFTDFETWHFTAEAVDHVILQAVPLSRAMAEIARDPDLQLALRALITRELAVREEHMLLLAYLPAEERLMRFLTAFAARRGGQRNGHDYTVLPMSRRDIADHIGLTVETVSRAFGALKRKGLIEMRGHERFRMVEARPQLAA